MKKWWVVRFPGKLLHQIEETIEREEYDIIWYCPMAKVSTTRKGLVHVVERPLFFNYMFWYYNPLILPWEELHHIIPYRVVKFKSGSASVTEKQLEQIRTIEKYQNNLFDLMRTDTHSLDRFIGRSVLIKDGVLNGNIGTVAGVKKAGIFQVEVRVFNRPVVCDISVEYVEFI